MTQAKIAELKANLSAYLSEVRNGGTVIVSDRSTPIARLVPYREDLEANDLEIVEAADPAREARKIKPVRPGKTVDLDRLLAETRGER